MALTGKKRKRRLEQLPGTGKKSGWNWIDGQQSEFETAAVTIVVNFPILELPVNLIYDILSRLPLRSICCCRLVCKTFLELLAQPYFAQLHLAKTSLTTVSLALQKNIFQQGLLCFHLLDIDEVSKGAPCSTACHHDICRAGSPSHPCRSLTTQNADFYFSAREAVIVGSCNGLLCLYYALQNAYVILNPILGEYVVSGCLPSSTPAYTYMNHSGFGFCPGTRQYKIVRFMCVTYVVGSLVFTPETEVMVEIHTLGSTSWRKIYNVPCPKIQGSFDPLLNGCFHWITTSCKPSDLICSLDLEKECLKHLPTPRHFSQSYVNKISWITVGILGGCLCLCYVYEDNLFEAWVMKDYGVKESWTKDFSITINFYSGLRLEHLNRPIKFLNNGDLWLVSDNSVVSFSPRAGTFKDFKVLEPWVTEVVVHTPSFISLKHALQGNNLEVKYLGRARPAKISVM
ncbi:unnamed protein product [Coffea canephora]|uniref:F-box domain-containing protein n=2 Tax=Coffea TaxID=13442 RepID=A0A068TN60_COFCA|nr:unnamed protein product [Coffea canephora]